MKKIYLLLLGLCLITLAEAQVSKTVEVTSGNLSSLLTEEEKSTLTSLTLTGTVDARDFKLIRDQMPQLKVLDIVGTTIEAYTDTTQDRPIAYAANAIPFSRHEMYDEPWTSYSLAGHPHLSVVRLPASLTAIGYRAFCACPSLTTVEIPSSLEMMGIEAFAFCPALATMDFSATSLTDIGENAFENCGSLTSIDLPPALKAIMPSAFSECRSLQSVVIPPSVVAIEARAFFGCTNLQTVAMSPVVTSIAIDAFRDCSSLTSITIPRSVTRIGSFAFYGCKSLQSVYAYGEQPVVIGGRELSDVFEYVDKALCILYVPYGSRELYATPYGWKDFEHIVEMDEFKLSPVSLDLSDAQGSVNVELTTTLGWTLTSDQPWMRVTPASGTGNSTITFTAEANPSVDMRTATVIFHTDAGTMPVMIVIQRGIPVAMEMTAGNLSANFSTAEQRMVNQLKLKGTMDARDFKFIRDELPLLTELDLSEVTIVAYSGDKGTYHIDYYQPAFYDYPANELPPSAFEGYSTNIKVDLPTALTSIGAKAFYNCRKLTELVIPSSVTAIGAYAFSVCALSDIVLPSSITTLSDYLFQGCMLTSFIIPSSVTSIGKYAFSACLDLAAIKIPNSVTFIGEHAFETCYALRDVHLPDSLRSIEEATFYSSGLSTLWIPSSVQYLDARVFSACYSLTNIYAYAVIPPDLSADAFAGFYPTQCTLYVPYGSRERYRAAALWKDFFRIVEMGEFSLENTTVTLEKEGGQQTVKLHSSIAWTASSDEQWLTVLPGSGTGGQWITLTADANTDTTRTALVTIYAEGVDSLSITVIQHGMTVGLDEMKSMDAITFHPNPFTVQLSIDIQNPSLKEVNVEIYTISGQKIKTLLRAQKGAKISCTWNGRNESGKQVPDGMYLLKVNGEMRKVVKD